jgi:hypothetical protein
MQAHCEPRAVNKKVADTGIFFANMLYAISPYPVGNASHNRHEVV